MWQKYGAGLTQEEANELYLRVKGENRRRRRRKVAWQATSAVALAAAALIGAAVIFVNSPEVPNPDRRVPEAVIMNKPAGTRAAGDPADSTRSAAEVRRT
jgi:hypothetical protein